MIHQKKHQITSDIIQYDVLDLYVMEPGIVVSEYKAEFELDIDFAIEINKQIGVLTDGKALPQLFIACPGLSVSKEVREWGASELANEYTHSSAIVCNLLSHRILGNFLIKVQRPTVPTKMFNNVDDAIIWLKASIQ